MIGNILDELNSLKEDRDHYLLLYKWSQSNNRDFNELQKLQRDIVYKILFLQELDNVPKQVQELLKLNNSIHNKTYPK